MVRSPPQETTRRPDDLPSAPASSAVTSQGSTPLGHGGGLPVGRRRSVKIYIDGGSELCLTACPLVSDLSIHRN